MRIVMVALCLTSLSVLASDVTADTLASISKFPKVALFNANPNPATAGTAVVFTAKLENVEPDSTGTFDVVDPSGKTYTFTAPGKCARFIPVE